jgi:hypothetical protein
MFLTKCIEDTHRFRAKKKTIDIDERTYRSGRHSKTSWTQQVSHLNNLLGGGSIPIATFDMYRTYVYGRSLVNPKS